jgi:hypothetical protein
VKQQVWKKVFKGLFLGMHIPKIINMPQLTKNQMQKPQIYVHKIISIKFAKM